MGACGASWPRPRRGDTRHMKTQYYPASSIDGFIEELKQSLQA